MCKTSVVMVHELGCPVPVSVVVKDRFSSVSLLVSLPDIGCLVPVSVIVRDGLSCSC